MSDAEFDQLENNVRPIFQEDVYFINQKLVLPSLGKGREDEFLEKLYPIQY